MFKIIKELFYDFIGTCDSCFYKNDCDHIKYGESHCWDNSYEPHYKSNKVNFKKGTNHFKRRN